MNAAAMNPADSRSNYSFHTGSAEVNRKRKVHVNPPPIYIHAKQRRRSERAEERQAESTGEPRSLIARSFVYVPLDS